MSRVPPKNAQSTQPSRKADVLEELPDLLVILANLKKILREESQLPKYRH
jgi:hypothetical protein